MTSAYGAPGGKEPASAFLRWIAGAAALLAIAGCAKKGPPTGGPPDIESPRLILAVPDSGAARVPLDVTPRLTFSEGMEQRSTGDAIALAPAVEIRRLRWSARTATVVLGEPLRAGQTYTLFVGGGARDRHGNPIDKSTGVVFTTGDSFPPGVLEGRLEARGFDAGQAYLWTYDVARGREPDSTGRDFDALGLVDSDGGFRVPGLAVPATYRLWVFADLNGNRSFEPQTDILAKVDTSLHVGTNAPVAANLVIRVVNPRAPARVRGTVLDSLPEREGGIEVAAVADTDTTRRVQVPVSEALGFELQLEAGGWSLRAFRDLDQNHAWDPKREPASPVVRVSVGPADEVQGIVLRLESAARGP